MRLKRIAAIFLLVYIPVQSQAWGLLGHRIVGEIASMYLTPKAKKAIAEILGNESIAMASNWGDLIKSDPSYNYVGPWHYINLDDSLSKSEFYARFEKDTTTDIFTKTKFCIEQLKNAKLDLAKKKMYLKLLIHFVGDIHQPMHIGRSDDQGGNRLKVFWFGEPTNLHRVWDEHLIEYQQLSYTEYVKAINFPTVAQKTEWQKQSMLDWVYESYQSRLKIYAAIKQPEEKLSYRYNFDFVEMLNSHLLKGGVRLAAVLNELYK